MIGQFFKDVIGIGLSANQYRLNVVKEAIRILETNHRTFQGHYFLCLRLEEANNSLGSHLTNADIRDELKKFAVDYYKDKDVKRYKDGVPTWWSLDSCDHYEERHKLITAYKNHLERRLTRCLWK